MPVEFYLFGAMLLGIAFLHRHALAVASVGLTAILAYEGWVSGFPTGFGLAALGAHFGREWMTLVNLLLLLVGFAVLSSQFELSNMPSRIPALLPDNWSGGLVLLAIVFVLSGFLDNIAAAVIGGAMARHVYAGQVRIGYLAAIVAAANAGGAGSVIGDTTTTLMWLKGISPLAVLPAYMAALASFLVIAPLAAAAQQRHHAILRHGEFGRPIAWRRAAIVGFVLLSAVVANLTANLLGSGEETGPWLGLAIWVALIATAPFAKPDWSAIRPGVKGALFLVALVASASLMPVTALPPPSAAGTLGLGFLSAVFDNIPLTALALEQGGYDWALLAFAVGFGGSMTWFGSSAGVALTNLFPEGRSAIRWLREGWYIPLGYLAGFGAMSALGL
ncbi:MAG TPA: citrate transporter [Stellaceae bacterium]|nr:citrate transporter [Stellaceae bacterium]